MKTIVKGSWWIGRVLMAVSAAFIGMSAVLATYNALARMFASGVPWAEELCSYLVVLMVYLSIPFLEFTGDQLCITAIDSIVKKRSGQRILNYLRGILTGASMLMLSYYGYEVMLKAFKRNQLTYTLNIPKGYLYAIAAGCLFITVLLWLVIMTCNKGEFADDY